MVPGKQPSRAVTEWCGRQEDLFICTIPAICCFVLFFSLVVLWHGVRIWDISSGLWRSSVVFN